MIISIDPSDNRPIYLQIVDEVRRAMVLGTAKAHDPLPSLRQLAAELRLNPNTVQQAYRELEREGLVYVQRGRGTYLAEVETSEGERTRLAQTVAERAVRDAHRNGLSIDELIEAIRQEGTVRGDGASAAEEEDPA